MNKEEILKAVESLSHSQGFYCRLYNALQDNDEALEYLSNQNFKDVVDLILFLEG